MLIVALAAPVQAGLEVPLSDAEKVIGKTPPLVGVPVIVAVWSSVALIERPGGRRPAWLNE